MRIKLLIGLTAAAVFAFAGVASASTKLLLTEGPDGPALTSGQYVEFFSALDAYEWTYQGITPFGCYGGYEGIYGHLVANNKAHDKIVIEGDYGNLNQEDVGACNYPQEVAGFPWTISLSPYNVAKAKGHVVAYEVVGGSPYCPQEGKKLVVASARTEELVSIALQSTMTKNLGDDCSLHYTDHTGTMIGFGLGDEIYGLAD